MRRQTTVGARSFDAPNLGADLGIHVARRFDLVFSLDASSRIKRAEYREWEENGLPIGHNTTLERLSFGGNVRYNFTERGQAISSFAWIPARMIPYVGAGGGYMWYRLAQKGDFVAVSNQQTAAIFDDELKSNGRGLMAQAFTGIDYGLNARWSLRGETRYVHSSARLGGDYSELGKIDLSGLVLNFGTSVRF